MKRLVIAPAKRSQPTRPVAYQLLFVGSVGIVVAAVMRNAISLIPGASGVILLYFGVRILREGAVAPLLTTAFDAIARGRADDAEALLDSIPARAREPHIGRALHLLRAMIATQRGDLKGALDHSSRAIGMRFGLWTQHAGRQQELMALGIRAIAAAAQGDAATAMRDVATIRSAPHPTPDTLACASLAEAVVLSRAGDREKLAALLVRDQKLLLEFTTPRDRAVVRALQRMVFARAKSVYRESARDVESAEARVASWIATIAPEAARYAPAGGPRAAVASIDVGAQPSPARAPIPAHVRKREKKGGPKAVALWVVMFVSFLAAFKLMSEREPGEAAPSPTSWADGLFATSIALGVGAFLAFMVGHMALNQRGTRKLAAARRLLALPDVTEAERAYTRLTKSMIASVAARAEANLASIAERRARFEEALTFCERGIARVANSVTARASLLPELLTERAYLLAVLGRYDESSAELTAIGAVNPSYALAATSRLRVRMVQAVRGRDLATARALAVQRTPDLLLNRADETLADVLLATSDAQEAEGEIDRLRAELDADRDLRAWLGAIWPDAERLLEQSSARAQSA